MSGMSTCSTSGGTCDSPALSNSNWCYFITVFPGARSVQEGESQGLLYAYVDDDVEGLEEPLFLLGGEGPRSGDSPHPREASRA